MKTLVLPVPGGTATKRLTRLLFVRAAAALLAFWVAGSCLAGDAVFSNDGQRVYAIGNADNKQVLREINLTEQTSRTISLSQLPSQQPLLVLPDQMVTSCSVSQKRTSGLLTPVVIA